MGNGKILIVEDELLIGENLKRSLLKNGYEVPSIAVTGEEAISMAERNKPDLVLMDIKLKGDIDGVEAAGSALKFRLCFSPHTAISTPLKRQKKPSRSGMY